MLPLLDCGTAHLEAGGVRRNVHGVLVVRPDRIGRALGNERVVVIAQ